MMRQYLEIRRGLPKNTLLLFRLGDFYEMFGEDAVLGSRVLGITLTKRNDQQMAGIPYHAGETYIAKVLDAGMKVAICEQTEAAKPGKLVNRSLVRILTPGTTLEENRLNDKKNHYLLALNHTKSCWVASWLDLSTGNFQITQDEQISDLLPIIHSLDPAELLLPESLNDALNENELDESHQALSEIARAVTTTDIPDYHFDLDIASKAIKEALGILSLDGFGITEDELALGPAGALIYYATEMLCAKPNNLIALKQYQVQDSLLIDPATQRNLEIFKASDGKRAGSLMAAIDYTTTSAGGRLLEQFLAEPPLDIDEISRRQNLVEAFLLSQSLSSELTTALGKVYDIKRILGRLQNRIRNPRELGGIRNTIAVLPDIKHILAIFQQTEVVELNGRILTFDDLSALLDSALNDELPSNLQDGGVIKSGYDAELDRLRSLDNDNKTWISDLENQERERTGIKTLKVKYNGAFGYFIEVTKSNLDLVPEDYIRKQTMVNAERFYTNELKQKEREIFHAEEMSIAREELLFKELLEQIIAHSSKLMETASALAELDVVLGWATLSQEWDYCKPEVIGDSFVLEIQQGRHPVIEQALRDNPQGLAGTHSFIPNDCSLSADQEQIAIITGPNMAGKSTYIRQNAVIALMAHIGCWVPAASCRMGVVDRIFSRVGASDELARGNSTFMVEMNETANILNNATERSLIILDEIGRGTSTYDGVSIAWAVVEYLHGEKELGSRTLFATHYHELTQLESVLPRLKNLCVAVKEWNDEIIFVRQVVEGAADRSYGIQVARLAGLPKTVIKRAQTILDKLEATGEEDTGKALPKDQPKVKKPKIPQNQLNLFG